MIERTEQIRERVKQAEQYGRRWLRTRSTRKTDTVSANLSVGDAKYLLAEVAALGERVRVLTEALSHYAEADHWGSAVGRYPVQCVYNGGNFHEPRTKNGYEVARAALAGTGAPLLFGDAERTRLVALIEKQRAGMPWIEWRELDALVARLDADDGQRHTLDDVLAKFGYTREQFGAALAGTEDGGSG